jgi:hypothetical protein
MDSQNSLGFNLGEGITLLQFIFATPHEGHIKMIKNMVIGNGTLDFC